MKPATKPPLQKKVLDSSVNSLEAKPVHASRRVLAEFKSILSTRVNASSLGVFRIAFGIIMALEAWSLSQPNLAAITQGSTPLETYYTGANIHFHLPFALFSWLPLFPPLIIKTIVALLATGGLLMAIGLFYRAAALTVFLCWGYLFAVESTRTYWQSHFYLELLTSFLMIWMPAANCFSIDAKRLRKLPTIPFWPLFLLRGQLLIAYFYAGVAKLNADWLLDAVPVRWFLARPSVTTPFERFLSHEHATDLARLVHSTGFAYFLSYTGVLFDLGIGFLFLFRRFRLFAMLLMVIFHATNHFLIFEDIGWFPLLGLATATIFFDPEWPQQLLQKFSKASPKIPSSSESPAIPIGRYTAAFVLFWLVSQTLIPLRHYAIPGDGRFTYEGLSFSWRLKADVHQALPARIFIDDPVIAGNGREVNWAAWHGQKVLYHQLGSKPVDWTHLPSLLIVAEPLTGERIVFNPRHQNSEIVENEAAVRQRIEQLWNQVYHRSPASIEVARPASLLLQSIAEGLRSGGSAGEADAVSNLATRARKIEMGEGDLENAHPFGDQFFDLMHELQARDPSGELRRILSLIQPFAQAGGTSQDQRPLFLISDPLLINSGAGTVKRDAWISIKQLMEDTQTTNALDIYTLDLETLSPSLPLASLVRFEPGGRTEVYWNIEKDLTVSKGIHISNQAFYLRRYARRLALLWQQEYGRRPKVRAITAVSFNGRPHQLLVDPEADLASVPVHWMRHNQWIRDLEMERIPRSSLSAGTRYVGER